MINLIKISLFTVLTALLMLVSMRVYAQEPEQLGSNGDWISYSVTDSSGKVCYMVSRPIKSEGKYSKRGDVYILITHRPALNTKDVFSFVAGYTLKEESKPTVTVDGNKFSLFADGETGWAVDAQQDKKITSLIQSGSSLMVEAVSSRGTVTKDKFSLKGSGAAYAAISKACGF